jgi:hypothetical protein
MKAFIHFVTKREWPVSDRNANFHSENDEKRGENVTFESVYGIFTVGFSPFFRDFHCKTCKSWYVLRKLRKNTDSRTDFCSDYNKHAVN